MGPLASTQTNFIIDIGNKAKVPIISYSATSPYLDIRPTNSKSSYFFRATQNDAFQVKAISCIVEAFGWRQVVPIYEDDNYVEGLEPLLTDALQQLDTRVPYRSVIPPSATADQLVNELEKLRGMQTRVFIVHMHSSLGFRLFTKANEMGMVSEGFVWIVTNLMTNDYDLFSPMDINSKVKRSMQGVLGLRTYVPERKAFKEFKARWKRAQFLEELNLYGLRAYDATKALAIAVERVGHSGKVGPNFKRRNFFTRNSTVDLQTIGVSQNGPKIREALLGVQFKGLAGDFSLANGQELESSALEIINFHDNGEKRIGFWTPQNGLVRKLDYYKWTKKIGEYNCSKANLGPIIWPGETIGVPKGWQFSSNGKKLKIGVPVKEGFDEFVNVTRYHETNNVSGYCIDIFDAVLKSLPYGLDYDLEPFAKPDGTPVDSYDDLIYQVYLGNFDAVVGDTTIRANRSLYVDFTLPYTESGVALIVPIIGPGNKNTWVFLKPLTWELWVTIVIFFVFVGFVVSVLEHRVNKNFQGPLSHQIGTGFWFSFSTMVFAHREKVNSNLARFVVIIWIFVVLILTQSYTASLTTLLTVPQLQPTTITDYLAKLLKNGNNVGYTGGPFIYGMLKTFGFEDSKIKRFKSLDKFDQAFSSKNADDSIAAALDEIPYMKLFLKKYCSKYSMIIEVDQSFKTDGFAFVFPRGSPLVPEISRAIVKLTEEIRMRELEHKWFQRRTCLDTQDDSKYRLGLGSFWGLFVIAGVSSFSALIMHAAILFNGQRHVIMSFGSDASVWERIRLMFEIFGHRDSSTSNGGTIGLPSDRDEGTNIVDQANTTGDQPIQSSCSNSDFSGEQLATDELK